MNYTFKQFKDEYPNDDACLEAIMQRRYGKTEACPQCGVVGKLTRIEGRRAYACKEGCHIYPCVGTAFEHSSTPLTLWFQAMYLFTATRNGVAAKELERQLGVTYKCAWRIGHELRKLMAARSRANNPGQLQGHIEIDETYIGGKVRVKNKLGSTNQGRHLENKTIVMGMVQRGGDFRGNVIASGKTKILRPLIYKNVAKGSVITTDTLSSYKLLNKKGYIHGTVNHSLNQWKNGSHHTNTVEGFWSHLKRGISSTHVHVSKKHMQKYVDEFGFRYNNRAAPEEMFRRMLAQVTSV